MFRTLPAVYVLAGKQNGTICIRVTRDFRKNVWEHTNNVIEGFTKRYGVHSLVSDEWHEHMVSAIRPEEIIKQWSRDWKLELIEKRHPDRMDL